MREIIFRGKRVDNGEWVQGYLFVIWEKAYILWGTTNGIPDMIEVILLMMYWLKCNIPINYHVHHADGNRLNASKENLSLVFGRVHNSNHNKGKTLTKRHKQQIAAANRLRKGKRRRYTRDVSARVVYDLKKQGLTFNQISKVLELDWGCVKQRYEDFIHDNPELLEERKENE